MPEKVSSLDRIPAVAFGARGVAVDVNPELALLAMRVHTEWSWLEHRFMLLFVQMLGANPLPGAAMYASLSTTSAQKAALRAVAGTFSDAHSQVFEVILALFGTIAKDRNKLAHWLWGYAPAIPDALLLAKPAAMVNHTAKTLQAQQAGTPEPNYPYDDIYVWKERDFSGISSRIDALTWHISGFTAAITPGPHSDEALQRLSNVPEIRERLDRQRQGPKNCSSA